MKYKIEKAIVASDIHHPFQDQALIEAAFKAWKAIYKKGNLKYIFLNGDIIDCFALTHFTRAISMSQIMYQMKYPTVSRLRQL